MNKPDPIESARAAGYNRGFLIGDCFDTEAEDYGLLEPCPRLGDLRAHMARLARNPELIGRHPWIQLCLITGLTDE